jgi:hypothetical protein
VRFGGRILSSAWLNLSNVMCVMVAGKGVMGTSQSKTKVSMVKKEFHGPKGGEREEGTGKRQKVREKEGKWDTKNPFEIERNGFHS